jgi:replicative DNA helicase
MADFENLLISKCVQHGGIEKLLSKGIHSDLFNEPENKEVWEFLSSHVKQYRSAPDFDTVKESFPEYKWNTITEPLDYVADQFIITVKRREAVKKWREVAKILDENDPKDMDRIEQIILEKSTELSQLVPSTNVSLFSDMPQRIDLYKAKKANGIQAGMLYGFKALDEATLGVHPHQLVTIAGPTGVGKSTLGMVFTVNHFGHGFNPMIISCEMDEEEIYRKLDSIAVGLRQMAIKELTLPGKDMKRWEEYAERLENVSSNIIVLDVDNPTVEKIYGETVRWNPDIVVVDYIQLLSGPKGLVNRWERVDDNAKALKRQARSLKTPVYALSQVNDEGELAGARAIGHHSDVVLSLKQNEEDAAMKKMNVVIEKNRMGPRDVIQAIYWDQANSRFEEWQEKHIYMSRDEDV